MVMQIKGKFIKNAALDSSKILLTAGQALRVLAQDGSEKRLIEFNSEGKVLVNGAEVALKSDIANTSSSISSSLAAEVAAREAADLVLDGKIATEKARAEAAEAALASDLAAETSARQSAVAGVQSDLDAEKATRAAGDTSTLNSAKAYADQKVADLVNSAPAVLDTLKELADAIGGDANFATTIANQIGTVSASVAAEEARAMTVEGNLAADIATEASTRAAAITAVQGSISAESSARAAAVSAEQTRAEAAEATLGGRLNVIEGSGAGSIAKSLQDAKDYSDAAVLVEKTRAESAEAGLDSRLDVIEGSGAGSVAKALQDAKDYSDANRAAEQSRAQTAEAGLASDIADVASDLAAETTARQNAITSVQNAISSEETRAMTAESALDARLDVLEGNGAGSVAKAEADAKAYADSKVAALVNSAPAVLDTLKELADALGQDPNFATTVAGQIGAVAADLATETSRAQSAESALSGAISAEESARMAAVSAEQSRAQAAESALSGRVDTLEAKAFYKEKFVLSQEDIDNGFIEFARAAMSNSVVAFADRLAIHQGADQDFTMAIVSGKSRMTFVNNLIDPSPEKLSAGDVINVTYMA